MFIRLFLTATCLLCTVVVNALKVGQPLPLWKQIQTKASGVAIGSAFMISSSLPSLAVDFDPSVYNNIYDDPLHPLCKRSIGLKKNAPNEFHYSGTAVGSKGDTVLHGCSNSEITEFGGFRKTSFDGTIDLETGRISAGDGIHEGIWEPANSVNAKFGDVDGIRWNDGNKWTVKTKSTGTKFGEFIVLAYVGLSGLAGVRGVSDAIRRKREEASS